MDATRFAWLRRSGCAPAALGPQAPPPAPLQAQREAWGELVWLPLEREAEARAALAGLPCELPLYPARAEQVPAVVDAWLWLHEQAGRGMEEAVLQVTDDPAHLRDYLAAERALWARIYEAHPHVEDAGLLPRALDEARWLTDLVLGSGEYEARSEFLTMSAFEVVARELLVTVRRAELLHLRDHLLGRETLSGW